MNVTTFLDHWSLNENPFRAEEARHDPIFSRLNAGQTDHPDFEKILGDLDRPATAIVFGEKGSGKTAIRLQIERRIRKHNDASTDRRVMLIAHDDLNPMLDRLATRLGVDDRSDEKEVIRALKKIRLVDHMDGILHLATRRLVDVVLERADDPILPPGDVTAALKKADPSVRLDLRLLQAVYDRDEDAPRRAAALRRRIRAPRHFGHDLWRLGSIVGWAPAATVLVWALFFRPTESETPEPMPTWIVVTLGALAAVWLAILLRDGWNIWRLRTLARKLSRRLRAVQRSPESLGGALRQLAPADRHADRLPIDNSDGRRYDMIDRLRRVLNSIGCRGVIVVMDRIDEPTLVNGDPGRMRAIIWPLLNNKLLQQEGIGFKLLLPLELRHELFRETSDFFQEARLDKQNLVERLNWSGAMLFDLCSARLNCCRAEGEPLSMTDIFDSDVSRQDLIDALDQMHQPRDAFKMLYQCIQDHCANVTEEQQAWRIPRHVLDTVRRQQAERVQMFHRGVRPA